MRYDSLIFDIDGTLWDTRALVAKGYNQQLMEEGHPELCITPDRLTPLFGKPLPEIADLLFTTLPKEDRVPLIDRCAANQGHVLWDDPCDVGYPRIRETMEALSRKYRLFIVSNSQKGYPELCIQKLGLNSFIEAHLCHGDTNTPKGQTILTLMDRYHIENPVYVGDTQGDYEATLDAGIPFIWASYGFGHPEGYTEKIQQFSDLLNL